MKILFFSTTLKGGGAERVLANVTMALSKLGHEIVIALNFNDCAYQLDPSIKVVNAEPRKWYKGSNIIRRFLRNIRMSCSFIKHTKHVINAESPDVIVTFMQCNMLAILLYHGKIPIVHSEHNAYDRKQGILSYFNRFFLNKFFDKVFVLTPYDQGFALAKGLKNTIVMANPNSYESLSWDEFKLTYQERANIMICGRIDSWYIKGFDVAIEVFAKIVNQYPDIDLDIVGGGSQKNIDRLKEVALKNGVGEKVHFLGYRNDMKELMRKYRVFLLSSRTEGFPMVVTEAMSQGLPCVAFDRLARAIIIDTKDGFLVENNNMDEMCEKVLSLLNDDELCYNIGCRALDNVGRFSSNIIAKKWEQVFYTLKRV